MESLKILIVEDDYRCAQRLENNIKKIGHQITGRATNVKEAITAFNKSRPDLVIMDIELGENKEGGIELTKTFNQIGDIPIIYYSDFLKNKTLRNKAAKTNSIAVLSKTHEIYDLEANIDRVIHIKNSNDAEQETFKRRFNNLFDKVDKIHENLNSLFQFLVFPFYKNSFWLTAKHGFPTRIFYKDICWIQTSEQKDTVRIVTHKKPIEYGITLSAFERKVEHPSLLRIHRSCIVNIDNTKGIDTNSREIIIQVGNKEERIRYSENYIKDFKEKIDLIRTK